MSSSCPWPFIDFDFTSPNKIDLRFP
jgi:hypothetical protein